MDQATFIQKAVESGNWKVSKNHRPRMAWVFPDGTVLEPINDPEHGHIALSTGLIDDDPWNVGYWQVVNSICKKYKAVRYISSFTIYMWDKSACKTIEKFLIDEGLENEYFIVQVASEAISYEIEGLTDFSLAKSLRVPTPYPSNEELESTHSDVDRELDT